MSVRLCSITNDDSLISYPEYVFVYGTLMKEGCNHSVMMKAGGLFKCKALTSPYYRLVSLGGYPGMIKGLDCTLRVVGELYTVGDIAPLDMLEGYPDFYGRTKISVVGVMSPTIIRRAAWAYFVNERPLNNTSLGIEEKDGVQWWKNSN